MENGTEEVKVLQSVTLLLTTNSIVRGDTLAKVNQLVVRNFDSSLGSTQIFHCFAELGIMLPTILQQGLDCSEHCGGNCKAIGISNFRASDC